MVMAFKDTKHEREREKKRARSCIILSRKEACVLRIEVYGHDECDLARSTYRKVLIRKKKEN